MNASDDMNISPEPSVLDGNAAAGLLQQIFAVDVTRASITCVACESVKPLASLRLFGVYRCAISSAALNATRL